jgi:pimeloyl-ACP methyl ester carboxylesterase
MDVTTDPARLASQGLPVEGVAADGVTDIVLRIQSSGNDCMELSVLTDLGSQSVSIAEDGGLRAIGSSRTDLSGTLRACAQTNNLAFAIYRASKDFPRQIRNDSNANQRTIFIQVRSETTGISFNQPIKVVRPPVALIHGLWSDYSAWNFFEVAGSVPLIIEPRFYVEAVDYSQTAGTGSFSENAAIVLPQIQNIVAGFKHISKVAAVQADVVVHSMGGNITRQFVLTPGFRSLSNFNQGYVHKLITIDTPHLGSRLANLLLNSNDFCKTGFSLFGDPMAGAVADLAVGSSALLLLEQNSGFPLQAHVIVGTASITQELEEEVLLKDLPLVTDLCPQLIPLTIPAALN